MALRAELEPLPELTTFSLSTEFPQPLVTPEVLAGQGLMRNLGKRHRITVSCARQEKQACSMSTEGYEDLGIADSTIMDSASQSLTRLGGSGKDGLDPVRRNSESRSFLQLLIYRD